MSSPDFGFNHQLAELERLRDRVSQLEADAEKLRGDGGRSADERFRLMADAAPLMIWMSGTDGQCTFVNKYWLHFRGRSLDVELGNGWTEGVHPDDLKYCLQRYLSALHARQSFRMEYRVLRHDGEYRWVEDTGAPLFEPLGRFSGFVGAVVDVTPRKRSELQIPVRASKGMRSPLTAREAQVLGLVADGRSTKEIAAALGISYKTADSHRSKIMEKMDVHETASLVRHAIRMGLVEP